MEHEYERNAKNPNYSCLTGKDFFGGTDGIRIVIIIYIFLSFILNVIISVVFGMNIKTKKIEFPIGVWVLLLGLFMNFIHTFTYFFEWVIKECDTSKIKDEEDEIEVGCLLVGNPNNLVGCYTQGFLLIFSSISQDILINIFYKIVNTPNFNDKKIIILLTLGLGVGFPFLFTLFLRIMGALGLNDKFCYVKKFESTIENNITTYSIYDYFQTFVMIVYFIRVINFIFTCYYLKKIWTYIKSKNEDKLYLFKAIFIPLIQLFTIGIGIIYRFINLISKTASASLAGPYLILNTVDGVLFPIAFSLQNDIFSQFISIIRGNFNKTIGSNSSLELDSAVYDDEMKN